MEYKWNRIININAELNVHIRSTGKGGNINPSAAVTTEDKI